MTGATTRTALYRLYDDAGTLLYVGISSLPWVRFSQHRSSQPWWPRVARHVIERFGTQEDAAEAERQAIFNEDPEFNVIRARPYGHEVRPLQDVPMGERTADLPVTADGSLDLMAAQEIARTFGIGPAFTHRIIRESLDFPVPIAHLSVGKVWSGPEIREWARRSGYPKAGKACP